MVAPVGPLSKRYRRASPFGSLADGVYWYAWVASIVWGGVLKTTGGALSRVDCTSMLKLWDAAGTVGITGRDRN